MDTSISSLRAQLADLSAQLSRRDQLDTMLQSLQSDADRQAQEEFALRRALEKEQSDVTRLEHTSASALLYTLLGRKDEQLDKERREAAAAKLKYDAAVRQSEDTRAQLDTLRAERAGLDGVAAQYHTVFDALQQLLRQSPDTAAQFAALESERAATVGQLREVEEAITAGEAAQQQANLVAKKLGSAAGWGTLDVLGGGLLSDLAKYSSLDEAQAAAEQLQILLSRFRTELSDVKIAPQFPTIQIDGFLRFADYFFDNLITDFAVLSQIQGAKQSIAEILQQLSGALLSLSRLYTLRLQEKAAIEAKISALVTAPALALPDRS